MNTINCNIAFFNFLRESSTKWWGPQFILAWPSYHYSYFLNGLWLYFRIMISVLNVLFFNLQIQFK